MNNHPVSEQFYVFLPPKKTLSFHDSMTLSRSRLCRAPVHIGDSHGQHRLIVTYSLSRLQVTSKIFLMSG